MEIMRQRSSQVLALLGSLRAVFIGAFLLRLGLLFYGHWQDNHSALKYTDVDYFVFTDAARFVSKGHSPYQRDTYRYTPLLAWLLVPTTWSSLWFAFGKCLFAAGDLLTGWLTISILESHYEMDRERAVRLSTIWLLNPMVATISTRGSSEGLLAAVVVALLWATLNKRFLLAGTLLGLAVHFKIYPFVYAVSIVWWIDYRTPSHLPPPLNVRRVFSFARSLITPNRLLFTLASLTTFVLLNATMFAIYGHPFLEHTFSYHLSRSDHRHNFSPYSTMLYQQSASQAIDHVQPKLRLESLAFIPQLMLSAIIIPLIAAPKDLASTMLAQTFTFVSFNKVCTSQYFLWYMVLLPFYLPKSTFFARPWLGVCALASWVVGQALWLASGYRLEFLGQSAFVPGLWSASLIFFLINTALLGVIISDVLDDQLDKCVKAKDS